MLGVLFDRLWSFVKITKTYSLKLHLMDFSPSSSPQTLGMTWRIWLQAESSVQRVLASKQPRLPAAGVLVNTPAIVRKTQSNSVLKTTIYSQITNNQPLFWETESYTVHICIHKFLTIYAILHNSLNKILSKNTIILCCIIHFV